MSIYIFTVVFNNQLQYAKCFASFEGVKNQLEIEMDDLKEGVEKPYPKDFKKVLKRVRNLQDEGSNLFECCEWSYAITCTNIMA